MARARPRHGIRLILRRLVPVIFALAAVGAGVAAPAVGQADSALPTTDVVLAIDQSGSTLQSDPQNQRIAAAQQFVNTAALLADSRPMRLGAVYFGSPVYPNSVQLVQRLVPASTPGLSTVFQAKTVPGTDFDAALCLAWSVVAEHPAAAGCELPPGADLSAPASSSTDSRSVVLVTDGFPAPAGVDLTFASGESPQSCPDGSPGHVYMCQLLARWRALTAIVPVKLFVIGIDQTDQWFPKTAAYWRAITGCQGEVECNIAVRRTVDPAQLVTDVMNAGTGGLVDLCANHGAAGDCTLPASLAEVQFVVQGVRSGDQVQIVDPAGHLASPGPGVSEVAQAGGQRWRITAPASGRWQVQSNAAGAQLSVVEVLLPQRFVMVPVPARPSTADQVTFELRPQGPLTVDLPSLIAQTFDLQLQATGGAAAGYQADQPEHLVESAADVLRTAIPMRQLSAGDWSASLVLKVGTDTLVIGDATFAVSAPTAVATSTAVLPTATAVRPTSTATPAPVPTATVAPTPAATATPAPPAGCQVAVSPASTVVPRYRLALVWSYPLRFHTDQEFSAAVSGAGCAAEPVNLHMQLSPVGGNGDACPPSAGCAGSVQSQLHPSLTLQPGEAVLAAPALRRQVKVDAPSGWTMQRDDQLSLDTPGWVRLEQRSAVGYWLPFAVVIGLLYGLSLASTYQSIPRPPRGLEQVPLRQLAVIGVPPRPIVRLGGIVWRRLDDPGLPKGVVTLQYLVAGEPVVRTFPNADASAHAGRPVAGPATDEILRSIRGVPLQELGANLIRLNRH